eukprot:Skav201606  [mRNA]  locus=scaffold152:975327:977714:- [translate_table: standard]
MKIWSVTQVRRFVSAFLCGDKFTDLRKRVKQTLGSTSGVVIRVKVLFMSEIEKRKQEYDIVKRRFEKLGYEVAGSLCNAADFGVPQQRRRAWVLGILKSELKTCGPRLVEDMRLFETSSYPSLRSIIDEHKSSPTIKGPQKTAKINKRIAQLEPLATSCSQREVAILACAVEELFVDHEIDAMQQLVVIQVDAQFNS